MCHTGQSGWVTTILGKADVTAENGKTVTRFHTPRGEIVREETGVGMTNLTLLSTGASHRGGRQSRDGRGDPFPGIIVTRSPQREATVRSGVKPRRPHRHTSWQFPTMVPMHLSAPVLWDQFARPCVHSSLCASSCPL